MIHLINEDGNSALKGRVFPIPKGIRKHLMSTLENYTGDKTIDGFKRLNNLLSMEDGIAYNEMKRIKNFFDNYRGPVDGTEYVLNGGDEMRLWVDNTLGTATKSIRDYKQAMKDAGQKNMFIRSHEKDRQCKTKKPTVSKIQTSNVGNAIGKGETVRMEGVRRKKNIVITESQAIELKELLSAD